MLCLLRISSFECIFSNRVHPIPPLRRYSKRFSTFKVSSKEKLTSEISTKRTILKWIKYLLVYVVFHWRTVFDNTAVKFKLRHALCMVVVVVDRIRIR